jgi:hypothetical protein
MVLSKLPDANRLPSELNEIAEIRWSCPLKLITSSPLTESHILIIPSLPAETISFPFGLNAANLTPPLCPIKASISAPVATSQTLPASSPIQAETIRLPSGLKETEETLELPCLIDVIGVLTSAASQTLISPELSPETTCLPSGLNLTHLTYIQHFSVG